MNKFQPGDKVTYNPRSKKGMVKSVHHSNSGFYFVVFNCAGDWENYQNYTGQLCGAEYLVAGWPEDKTEIL